MNEENTIAGTIRYYNVEEAQELFAPLRDQIFDTSSGEIWFTNDRIFRNESWLRILIRDGLQSDRSRPPREFWNSDDDLLYWVKDDMRDPLLPLFEALVEDGVREIIHMFPVCDPEFAGDAFTTAPTRSALRYSFMSGGPNSCSQMESRLLFDQTGRWGFYSDFDYLGILGGEPELMKRYISHAGGMEFIRQKADAWFSETYYDWKSPTVPHAYELAGWDNPPIRMDDGN